MSGKLKISIRFYNDREVRAVWDDEHAKWYFSVLDIVGVLNEETDYNKTRNYWKYLKAKLKKENNQLGSATTQLKLTAADSKKYNSDIYVSLDFIELAKHFPNTKAMKFLDFRGIIKNTYRTLVTRGMEGCYVWGEDEELRVYLKNCM